ncbi:MAG: HAD family hydrolase [Nitrospirota bacterium]
MDKSNGIKAVFFDLGKVLLSFNHENIVGRLLSKRGADEDMKTALFTFLFDFRDGLCNIYDEGLISSADFYREIDSRFPLNASYREFTELWNDIFTENRDVSALMDLVRQKRPVYLLSNVNELHWEFCREKFGCLRRMDGWVLSYEIKSKKPKAPIYRAALEKAGAGPGESVFIDDLAENTEAAEKNGIRGITFTGAKDLREILLKIGVI